VFWKKHLAAAHIDEEDGEKRKAGAQEGEALNKDDAENEIAKATLYIRNSRSRYPGRGVSEICLSLKYETIDCFRLNVVRHFYC
jgi:hypothetical protein